MRRVEPKSSASAGSCHAETAVHTRRRAGWTARPRTPLVLILSGLIVIGSVAPPAAEAQPTNSERKNLGCEKRAAQAKAESGSGYDKNDKASFDSTILARITDNYVKDASNAFDLLGRTFEVYICGNSGA
jgi:hypothetical protein